MFLHDGLYDVEIQVLVVVYGYVSRAHHALKTITELNIEMPGVLEKGERLSALLRHAEAVFSNEVHSKVNGRLAHALQVQDNRILARNIVAKVGGVALVFILDPLETPLDDACFVEYDIVSYKPAPAPARDSEFRHALRSATRRPNRSASQTAAGPSGPTRRGRFRS